jgi:4-amino-4-deoxy-L-arabinose transferase-like glycosyltransferase
LSDQATGDAKAMLLILLIIVVLLLFGGGGGFYGRRARWGPRGFGGLLVTVLILILLIWAVNELIMPPLPMPAGAPSIIR